MPGSKFLSQNQIDEIWIAESRECVAKFSQKIADISQTQSQTLSCIFVLQGHLREYCYRWVKGTICLRVGGKVTEEGCFFPVSLKHDEDHFTSLAEDIVIELTRECYKNEELPISVAVEENETISELEKVNWPLEKAVAVAEESRLLLLRKKFEFAKIKLQLGSLRQYIASRKRKNIENILGELELAATLGAEEIEYVESQEVSSGHEPESDWD